LNEKDEKKFRWNVANYVKIYDEKVLEKIIKQSRIKIEVCKKELKMRKNGKSNNELDKSINTDNE